MKKMLLFAIAIAISLGFTACSSKIEKYEYKKEMVDAPDWVFEIKNNPYEGIASAKITPAGLNFAETEAVAAAKDKIARQVSTKVYNTFKQFTQTTGTGDIVYIDKVTADISQQVATQELTNSRIEHRWISKTGWMWVKVSIEGANVRQIVRSSVGNASAMHQQDQAEKNHKALEKSIDNNL